jgi:hypothetical protein
MDSEAIRNLMLRSINGDKAANDEVRDWPREKTQEMCVSSQIRNWVREEFVNRWRNIGLNYTHGIEGQVPAGQATNFDSLDSPLGLFAMQNPDELSSWQRDLYKGPKTAWVRVASNAEVKSQDDPNKSFKGFILQGNGNFHDTYGFDKGDGYNGGGGEAKTLLGYDQSTPPQRHEISEPDYKHRPTPGITSVENEDVDISSGIRKSVINFNCWSPAQLDYIEQYFFQPSMSISVEWGWNTYPRDALLPLNDDGLETRKKIWRNESTGTDENGETAPGAAAVHTRNGQGNYGWVMGFITSYSSSIREDGGFDCTIEVKSPIDLARFTKMEDANIRKKDLKVPTTYANFISETLNRLLVGNTGADYARIYKATQRKGKVLNDEAKRRRHIDNVTRAERADGHPWGKRDGVLEKKALDMARGRFFTFNAYSSSKPYYAGKANEGGSYITVGFFIDTINLFFSRVSGSNLPLSEFSCWNSRATAHPNIKSTDGSVLLIPNSLAPRWNVETYLGGSVGERENQDTEPMAYQLLQKGNSGNERYTNLTSSFVSMVNAMNTSDAPVTTLEEAMKASPRDDLHRYLSAAALGGYDLQHPLIAGKMTKENLAMINSGKPTKKIEDAYNSPQETIQAFPDFKTIVGSGESAGYSGRICDLFVNLKIIREAANHHDNPGDLIMDVMKQVSHAAGDIWDFRLINGDTTTSTPNVIQLIDANYKGVRPVGELKKKAWVFPAHRADGIIREMDWSIELSNEIAIMTLFMDESNEKYSDSESAFEGVYSDKHPDLLFGGPAKNPNLEGNNDQSPIIDSAQKTESIPDKEKYIVSMSTQGLKPGAIKSFANYKTDPDLIGTYDYFQAPSMWWGKPKKVIKSKKYWITYPNPKTGVSLQISADNVYQRQMNVKMVTERMGVKPEDIKFAPGSVDNRGKFGSSMAQTGVADFVKAKRRIHKIWVNDNWLKLKRNFSGNRPQPLPDGIQGDDNKIKKLIGHEIKFYKYGNVAVDEANPPKSGKLYDIISASIPRNSKGELTDVDYDGPNTGYILHIQERRLEGTILNRSMIERYQQAKKDGAPIPSDIADLIKKNEISEEDILTEQWANYKSSSVNKQNMSVTNQKIRNTAYGASEDDYELDIEMVDPNTERMLKFCKVDKNAKNNMVHNMAHLDNEVTLTFDGIFGLRLMDVFNCTGVPTKYYANGIWTITKITHTIADGDWQTSITALWSHGKSGISGLKREDLAY